jgi:hypothetical protein
VTLVDPFKKNPLNFLLGPIGKAFSQTTPKQIAREIAQIKGQLEPFRRTQTAQRG